MLGLDLQGGSYLLLEVDSNYIKKEKLDQIRDDARRVLREAKIVYTGLNARNDAVEVRISRIPSSKRRCRNCVICRSRWADCSAPTASAAW